MLPFLSRFYVLTVLAIAILFLGSLRSVYAISICTKKQNNQIKN
ncbi:hypothetical protein APA_160 [Pseudanabaena sp. lw0831]|nr:hypothetical protein APA_160 [Pseudanabaena sp. lw0831]